MSETGGPEMAETPKPRRRVSASPVWMRVLLVGSLALNLLILGLVAGAMVKGPPPADRSPGGADLAGAFYMGALPPEAQRDVRRMMWRHVRDFREGREELKAEVEATLALLRAETVDVVALQEAVRSQRAQLNQRREVGDKLFIDYIAGMSLEERRAYADRLEEMLQRPWRR